ncbi:MAG: tRNA (adenosine(37)-N6)-dimethylallyltransferase MiaA [Chloroflexi bacterium]|nr:tRNA (adenosine(37)-N6)-dimethylallyltransferase MiaA [Chloroflexota bacterium]
MTPPLLLVIVGPTAAGKTRLAVALARALEGEIVGADSRQVYRGLDIATGKPTLDELGGIPHYLLDVADPTESYSLVRYCADAEREIAAVRSRGRLPILVGGTGLYIRGVCDGLIPPAVPPQPELRRDLQAQWEQSPELVLTELRRLDQRTAETIDLRNRRRVIRAIEICSVTGKPLSLQRRAQPKEQRLLILGLSTERRRLHELADARIAHMFRRGLVNEVHSLIGRGFDLSLPAFSAVGYREVAGLILGQWDREEAERRMRVATHAYQRRQLVWLRPDPRVHWIDSDADTATASALHLIEEWLRD